MTEDQLDELVAAIGEEILTRLGLAGRTGVPEAARRATPRPHPLAAPVPGAGRGIAKLIDHTLLRPEATHGDITKLCDEARRFHFASVCVNPYWVAKAAAQLAGTGVKVCTVAGFPLGATTTEAKCAETAVALRCGATEIDMVLNIGALRARDAESVRTDILAVVKLAHAHGGIVKVIIEAALLDDGQKVLACQLAQRAGADYVKTSTGLASHGATVHDVALMRQTVGHETGVKAAGGIRTLDDAQRMVAAGATRIGTSSGVKIMEAAGVAGDGG